VRGRRARAAAAAAVLGALTLLAPFAARAAGRPSPLRAEWLPAKPRNGDVALLSVRGQGAAAQVEGSVGGRPLRFFPHGEGHAALVGFDLDVKPGAVAWEVAAVEAARLRTLRGRVTVRARAFGLQRLTLPSGLVDLDPAVERRAVAEGEAMRALYATVTPERLWRGRFIRPVAGTEPGTGFGVRRLINGKPRAPHGGADYAASTGTAVLAANAGRVALVAEYFFPGRLVIVDHGLGLYTLYFHLDAVAVAQGDLVERAQVLGTVGATGRVTGPHLHFGVQVGAARVDPATLLGLDAD
jgi:murein DD-endopeptidase MepM/ murein hydrolase activator NlpD